jgi:hypothetical protein
MVNRKVLQERFDDVSGTREEAEAAKSRRALAWEVIAYRK